MLRLALLVGLVAVCVAKTPIEHCCSYQDRTIVRKEWNSLWKDTESSKFKIALGRKILLKVVEAKPEAKELFKNVNIDDPNSGEFAAHLMRILNALDMAVNLLDDPNALEEALDHLADQHRARPGVKREHFQAFAEFMFKGLDKLLDNFTTFAWKACMSGVLNKVAGKLQA
jgi:hemoglobin-like flavoprotein